MGVMEGGRGSNYHTIKDGCGGSKLNNITNKGYTTVREMGMRSMYMCLLQKSATHFQQESV